MTAPRFSLSLLADSNRAPDARTLARLGERCEALGFHAIYQTDHFLYTGPTLHSGSALAVLAGATERIRLGFAAYVLPLRHPIAAAKELAMLDGLTGGRLIAGMAAGSHAPEFAAFGIPFEERGARLDEGIEAVRALWTEPEASFEGRLWQFQQVALQPKPLQQPHPPIWIGSWTGTPRAAARVARVAAGWQASGLHTTVAQVRTGWAEVERACAAIGRDPATVGRAYVNAITWLAPDSERAWAAVSPALRRQEELRLIGSPEDVIAKLRALVDAGIEEISFLLPTWSDEQLTLIGRELMPAFEA